MTMTIFHSVTDHVGIMFGMVGVVAVLILVILTDNDDDPKGPYA